jgi:hypothetical protein
LTKICQEIAQKSPSSIIFYDCGARDLWRFENFYHAAEKSKKKLIVDAKIYAYLQMCVETKISNLTRVDLDQIKIYLPQIGWGIYSEEDYSNSDGIKLLFKKEENWNLDLSCCIKAEQIRSNPGQYIMYLPFYALNLLLDLHPFTEAYYIQSFSDPFDEEGEIKEDKRQNWLQRFGIKPENQFKVHCSGHAFLDELVQTIEAIKPKKVLPIHTIHPEMFKVLGISSEIHILETTEANEDELGFWYEI